MWPQTPFLNSSSTTLQLLSGHRWLWVALQSSLIFFTSMSLLTLSSRLELSFPTHPSGNLIPKATSWMPWPCPSHHCIPSVYHDDWQSAETRYALNEWIFVSFSKIHFLIKSFPIPFSTGPQSIMVLEFFCGHFHIRSGIIVTVYSSPQAPFSNLHPPW